MILCRKPMNNGPLIIQRTLRLRGRLIYRDRRGVRIPNLSRPWSALSAARLVKEASIQDDVLACSPPPDGVPWLLVGQLLLVLPAALWTWKVGTFIREFRSAPASPPKNLCVDRSLSSLASRLERLDTSESIFQRRLLYMPYFPPGSRTQELDPADPMLRGLTVRKLSFAPVDGSPRLDGLLLTPSSLGSRPPEGLIYYLQGNAGNTLARLPKFRELLFPAAATDPPTLGLFALSPRGYWSSGGPLPFPLTALTPPGHRLSQRGLLRDYGRVLAELGQRSELKNVPVWLHGHSLGGAVAAQLLAEMCKAEGGTAHIAGLILENPLPSVPHMVKVLYPSKWLPYHYLGGFARDRWDSSQALHSIHHHIPLLVIQSEHDELVPPLLTRGLYDDACASRLSDPTNNPTHQPITQHAVIPHALHDSAFSKARYRLTVHRFISRTMPHKK
ncbi:hypothetical protein PSTT_12890 [Puccinia striiformis]|uniref:AB hydrolase-1 domain-containing protein n=1 Tax=Puccinia striiformis TaxID=27350 RepID=A0A2S4UU34_9BASI|nr:hypothetical protein PSTT_12890 [Puccinia striiformis]